MPGSTATETPSSYANNLPLSVKEGMYVEKGQKEDDIKSLINKKISYSAIGRILGVHRLTVSSFVREKI
jgi:DNA invertase Pin-like site-specific DNA recombinase